MEAYLLSMEAIATIVASETGGSCRYCSESWYSMKSVEYSHVESYITDRHGALWRVR